MENKIDLTKILKKGDIVWSTRVGAAVTISNIIEGNDYPIRYQAPAYTHPKRTDKYGYTSLLHSPLAVPDLIPDRNVRNWNEFKLDLLTDTPVMVSNDGIYWRLNYYQGKGRTTNSIGDIFDSARTDSYKYIIPVGRFNFKTRKFNTEDNYSIE